MQENHRTRSELPIFNRLTDTITGVGQLLYGLLLLAMSAATFWVAFILFRHVFRHWFLS